jgi:hypothetical protein
MWTSASSKDIKVTRKSRMPAAERVVNGINRKDASSNIRGLPATTKMAAAAKMASKI